MFKTPKFWLRRNLLSYLLLPFSFVYFVFFYLLKYSSKRTKISKPVICIGNIIAGGSGKTPTAIALGKILDDLDVNFTYLSRGYKRKAKSSDIIIKKGAKYNILACGDEPALLSEYGDVVVSNNKLKALKDIDSKNYGLVVLDDGIQNNKIFSDLRIVVIDGKIGFGNSFLMPAGPLRENIKAGLKKADLVLVIGKYEQKLLDNIDQKKLITANINIKNIDKFRYQKLVAFCGLAYPDKFFSLLKQNDLEVIDEISFVDHYNYKDSDLAKILFSSLKKGAKLITTKKDWVKFPRQYQEKIHYLDIELEFDNAKLLEEEIKRIL